MLYPDPYLEPFDGGTKYFQTKSDYLSIDVSPIEINSLYPSFCCFVK